nr:AzlD domain-containing protein [uncultured Schaedlerella sp.]
MHNMYLYLLIMAGVSYLVRVLPMTLIRRPIKNRFIRSFLYYVPYVTLAVMTFPAIVDATQSPLSGLTALAVGMAAAWLGADLFKTAVLCCASVLAVEFFLF